MDGLTPQQQLFVQEHLSGKTATAAYRKAYPKVKSDATAAACAARLLGKAKVLAAVRKAADGAGLVAERTLREVASLAYSCVSHYAIDDSGEVRLAGGAPPDAMQAVASIKKKVQFADGAVVGRETEIRLWDKVGSLRMAMQHQGLLDDVAAGGVVQQVTYIEVRLAAPVQEAGKHVITAAPV